MAKYDLNGKVAVVTGAARGIGLATASSLASRGASVVIVDLDREQAEAAAAQVNGALAVGLAADVTDRDALEQVVENAVEQFGRVDVVVANAGIAPQYATVRAMTRENFARVIDVNLMGVVNTVDAALPQITRNGGHIVLIASVYAFQNGVGMTPYAMSKAAVEQLGRALRVELVQHGASASVAYFGLIDTQLVHRAIDADPAANAMFAATPKALLKRLPVAAAGEAIARGVEQRAPRIIAPRRFAAISALRGILGPLADRQLERDKRVQAAVSDMDARADQQQPTTA